MDAEVMFDVRGRVAIVTGGLGRLGQYYVRALAARGVTVLVLDCRAETVRVRDRFSEGNDQSQVRNFIVDITDRAALARVGSEIRSEFGEPHILVNNAAIDAPPDAPISENGPFETYPDSSFRRVMEVNVTGTMFCCQEFGGGMAKAGRGAIVNISSIYGLLSPVQDIYEYRRRTGEPFYKPVAYSVSKSAILNLTRYLATYWAKQGVRVNTLTFAGAFDNQAPEFLEEYCRRMPMGRMASPDEFVGPLLFLVSDAASYVTGTNLVVDGGWTSW